MADHIRVVIEATADDLKRALREGSIGFQTFGAEADRVSKQVAKSALEGAGGIDKLGRAISETTEKTGRLREAIRRLDEQDTGSAKKAADLKVLQHELEVTERRTHSLTRAQELGLVKGDVAGLLGGAGGGGGGVAQAVGSGGGLPSPPGWAGIAAAAVPAVGAGVPLAGSLGAGALGAGALGIGGLGILGAGLGPMLAVLKPAADDLKKVQTAYQNLLLAQNMQAQGSPRVVAAQQKVNAAIQVYGQGSVAAQRAQDALTMAQATAAQGSPKVLAAQQKLNALVADAGPQSLAAAKAAKQLDETWQEASKGALKAAAPLLTDGLKTMRALMPTVAKEASRAFGAIEVGMKPVFQMLRGKEMHGIMETLSKDFAKLAPPTLKAFGDIFLVLMRVAREAAPYVVQLAAAFASWADGLVRATGPGSQLHGIIAGLVSQFRAWMGFIGQLSSLLFTLLSAGAGMGKTFLGEITKMVAGFNQWLNTREGQQQMRQFFSDSITLVKQLFVSFGPLLLAITKLVISLMPTLTVLMRALTPVFQSLAVGIGLVADLLNTTLARTLIKIGVLIAAPGVGLAWAVKGLGVALDALKPVLTAVGGVFASVWHGIQRVTSTVVDALLGLLSTLLGAWKGMIDAFNVDVPLIGHVFGTTLGPASRAIGDVQHHIDSLRGEIRGWGEDTKKHAHTASQALGKAGDAATAMAGTTNTALRTVGDNLKGALGALGVKAVSFAVKDVAGGAHAVAGLATRAVGGWIGDPGERGPDDVPVVVGRGEAILNADQQHETNQALAFAKAHRKVASGNLHELFAKRTRPHYMAHGGFAGGGFVSTAYGPPWDAMEGGGTTFTGVKLGPSIHDLVVAVDPSVIPLHSKLRITPNPFGTSQLFSAEDTGGAIVGDRIDFYDWLGRSHQNAWGRRPVNVQVVGRGGPISVLGGPTVAGPDGQLSAPHITGPAGALLGVAQGTSDKVTAAANQYLAAHQPVGGTGGAAFSAAGLPTGVVPWGGGHIAAWLAPVLDFAHGHGWTGGLSDTTFGGFRGPGMQALAAVGASVAAAPGASHHEGFVYPDGAVDVTGWLELSSVLSRNPQIARGFQWTGQYLGGQDPYHFSVPGSHRPGESYYGLGGFARAAAGRAPEIFGRTEKVARRRGKGRSLTRREKLVLPFKIADVPELEKVASAMDDRLGALDSEEGFLEQIYNDQHHPQDVLTQEDIGFMASTFGPAGLGFAAGSGIADDELLNRRTKRQVTVDRRGVLAATIERIKAAVVERQVRMGQIKAYVRANMRRVATLRQDLADLHSSDLRRRFAAAMGKDRKATRIRHLEDTLRTAEDGRAAERKKGPRANRAALAQWDQVISRDKQALARERVPQTAASKVAIANAVSATRTRLGGELGKLGEDNQAFTGALFPNPARIPMGGMLGDIQTGPQGIDAMNTAATGFAKAITQIDTQDLPGLDFDIRDLLNRGARSVAPSGAGGGVSGASALTQQLLDQALRALAISQSQFQTLQGFAPLVAGRLVGSFAQGTDFVQSEGLALVHRGEQIIPDPAGAWGPNTARQSAAAGPLDVRLTIDLDEPGLLKVVDARVEGRAAAVSSAQIGRRQRMIAAVTT